MAGREGHLPALKRVRLRHAGRGGTPSRHPWQGLGSHCAAQGARDQAACGVKKAQLDDESAIEQRQLSLTAQSEQERMGKNPVRPASVLNDR